jgi:hypothetical protein
VQPEGFAVRLQYEVTPLFARLACVFSWREKLFDVPPPLSLVRPVALGKKPSADVRVPLVTVVDANGLMRGPPVDAPDEALPSSVTLAPTLAAREGGGE